jgi:hypothetical protein
MAGHPTTLPFLLVIPAQAGIQRLCFLLVIPACF